MEVVALQDKLIPGMTGVMSRLLKLKRPVQQPLKLPRMCSVFFRNSPEFCVEVRFNSHSDICEVHTLFECTAQLVKVSVLCQSKMLFVVHFGTGCDLDLHPTAQPGSKLCKAVTHTVKLACSLSIFWQNISRRDTFCNNTIGCWEPYLGIVIYVLLSVVLWHCPWSVHLLLQQVFVSGSSPGLLKYEDPVIHLVWGLEGLAVDESLGSAYFPSSFLDRMP